MGRTSPDLAKRLLAERLAGHKAEMFPLAERIALLETEANRLKDLAAAQDASDASAKRALETKRLLNQAGRERAERETFITGILANLTTAENRQREAVDKQVESLRFARAQLGRTADMQAVYNAAQAAGVKVTKEFTARIKPEIEALRRKKEALEAAAKAGQQVTKATVEQGRASIETSRAASDMALTFTSAFEDAVVGGKKFSDILRGIGQDFVRIALQVAVTAPAKKFLEAAFKSILGFAHGGRPQAGRAAVVGERGPEIFVPDRAGRVLPNNAAGARALTARMGGGGGASGTVIVNLTVEAGVSQTVRAEMLRLLPAIKAETIAGVQEARRRDPRFFGGGV